MDSKELTIEKSFTISDIACYRYRCGRCGKYEVIPQIIVKQFSVLAPKGWCCVAQDDDRHYFCMECSIEIGIGI